MTMMRFWQRLLAAEISPIKSRAIIDGLGSSSLDPLEYLRHHPVLSEPERKRMSLACDEALARALKSDVRLIPRSDYPEPLNLLENAPPALFVNGDFSVLAQPTVAIVGTRAASSYGKACAYKFAEALAKAGVTIVSGGALGIDAAAHKGALEAGGKTVAVIAGGIDNVYPAVHASLFMQIRESGCVVSQFAVGTKPNEYKFLMRNDVIAAASLAVLLIEAPPRSGALRTANSANDLGREVFVVPGNISMRNFQGSFNMIRDGATLVYHPDQVLEALGLEPNSVDKPVVEATGPQERIMSVMGAESLPTELIVSRCGLDAPEVLSELTILELEGRVLRDSTGYALKP